MTYNHSDCRSFNSRSLSLDLEGNGRMFEQQLEQFEQVDHALIDHDLGTDVIEIETVIGG